MFKVLHIASDKNFERQVETIVSSKGGSYKFIYDHIIEANTLSEEYDLVVMEIGGQGADCKKALMQLQKRPLKAATIIVIADGIEFKKQAELFEMGVMVVLERTNFDFHRFDIYIDTVKRDIETVKTLRHKKIAVVDDSRFSLEVIRSYFEKFGIYNVTYFQDSEVFMEDEKDFDLFLVDMIMPNYNGEDVIYAIREKRKNAVIILVTTYSQGTAIQHCLLNGANDFILKPFDLNMFMLRISTNINHQKLSEENEKNLNLLYEKAIKDGLTGAYNRTYFIENLKRIIAEHNRTNLPFSLILMDIDNFKLINDEFGHLKGDSVLVQTAELLRNTLRTTDIICRWGGEEFCIILPNTDREAAIEVANKIQRKYQSQVTASFGVTAFESGEDEETLFKRLDNSLYLAKLTGKNKVVSNEELVLSSENAQMVIEWGPFFRSGNAQIDLEHRLMIQLSNTIIEKCFMEDSVEETIELFNQLIEDTVKHFESEEAILAEVAYMDLEEHKRIHKTLVDKTLLMQEGLISGTLSPTDVAKYLIQDVVIGHIIKNDFDYYRCFR